jgi:beta-1,4-N-acetylglucosaminyltransferase
MSKCIFVTVGTTQFDRLIETIFDERSQVLDTLDECFHARKLIVQTGQSPMPSTEHLASTTIEIESYQRKDSISDDIKRADLVISHAGAGTILEVLEAGKPLLVVVNEKLMGNHQLEIADQMEKEGYLSHCTCDTLADGLRKVAQQSFKQYKKGNPALFGRYLNQIVI